MGFRVSSKLIIFFSVTIACALLSNQFMVQEKTKPLSTNKLKEECCRQCTDIIQEMPALMHMIASTQSSSFDTLQDYIDGDGVLFKKLTKEQLIKYNKLLNDIAQLCQNFTTEITSILKQINELKSI